jgi:hypothetical protein
MSPCSERQKTRRTNVAMIPASLVGFHSTRAPPDAVMDEAAFRLTLRPDRSSHGCGTGIRLRSSIPGGTPDKTLDEGSKHGWFAVDMKHDQTKAFVSEPSGNTTMSSSGPAQPRQEGRLSKWARCGMFVISS